MKTTSVQTEGFEGILYPGNGRKDKVLIVMSGSDGGMTLTKQESEFYHRNGFPALALALFKTKQTPPELSRVPVEYVERAIAWLKAQGYEKIAADYVILAMGTRADSETIAAYESAFDRVITLGQTHKNPGRIATSLAEGYIAARGFDPVA